MELPRVHMEDLKCLNLFDSLRSPSSVRMKMGTGKLDQPKLSLPSPRGSDSQATETEATKRYGLNPDFAPHIS